MAEAVHTCCFIIFIIFSIFSIFITAHVTIVVFAAFIEIDSVFFPPPSS